MIEQRTAHTADLDDDTKTAVRALMDAAFDGVSDDAFDNTLGGVHALVFEDGELIGHASVVQRRLLHRGRALRSGYIEGVAVRSDRRRRRRCATSLPNCPHNGLRFNRETSLCRPGSRPPGQRARPPTPCLRHTPRIRSWCCRHGAVFTVLYRQGVFVVPSRNSDSA